MSGYPIPNVIARDARGERILDVFSHLLSERVVYVGTAIDAGVANALIGQLLHLDAESPERDIQLYVNCEGGDPAAALAVYDTMRFVRADVATTCVGQAVGVGAMLLAAGARGKRGVLPHARVVLHQPAAQSRGPIPDLIVTADELVRVRGELERVLAEHTAQTVDTLRRETDRDRVLPAADAVAFGLADRVLAGREGVTPRA